MSNIILRTRGTRIHYIRVGLPVVWMIRCQNTRQFWDSPVWGGWGEGGGASSKIWKRRRASNALSLSTASEFWVLRCCWLHATGQKPIITILPLTLSLNRSLSRQRGSRHDRNSLTRCLLSPPLWKIHETLEMPHRKSNLKYSENISMYRRLCRNFIPSSNGKVKW